MKPGFEPVVLARRPLAGTVAATVQEWGTGALNIDACRIDTNGEAWDGNEAKAHEDYSGKVYGAFGRQYAKPSHAAGRWPANVLLDETAANMLDAQSGDASYNPAGAFGTQNGKRNLAFGHGPGEIFGYGDRGGASRFFYTAKASRAERNTGLHHLPATSKQRFGSGGRTQDADGEWVETHSDPVPMSNVHPTVKPVALMRWLCRLATPPGGVILDPFVGSGSTAVAARAEGFRCIGIDQDAEYLGIAAGRLSQLSLFADDSTPAVASPPPVGNGRDGEASADRRYTERGGTNFAPKPGRRRYD